MKDKRMTLNDRTRNDQQRDAMLEEAYRNTSYFVDARPEPIEIRVGERTPRLDRLLVRRGVRVWAFVTPDNPYSQRVSTLRNVRALDFFTIALARNNVRTIRGISMSDDGDWPAEPSMLLLGVSAARARALGRRFRQNAIVVGKIGGVARLLWCTARA